MSTNLFGIDVSQLDVTAFLASWRFLFALGAVAFLGWLARFGKPLWLMAGVLIANTYVFWVTNYPLQRLYALGPSQDRVGNLALCQVVAAGNSPLQTFQVGQLHFEPFWGLLLAALSGWDPERVLRLYPFLPLVMAWGFALSLYVGMKPHRAAELGGAWTAWERAMVGAFATLLSSSPLDFIGTYHVPWALTFLLKPNHALGLVLFPLLLRAFASIRGWTGRLAVGFLLQLLGWVFVLHMVYVAAGLLIFALLSVLARDRDARRNTVDVVAVLGVNVLIVSPYLYMLFVGYPFLVPLPIMKIAPWSAHLLETTTRVGWIFPLGVWGALVAYRRGDRFGKLWASQVLGAHLIWWGYLILSALQRARERDEIYYWVRFLLAASAGVGAWDLAARAASWLRKEAAPALRAALVGAMALPFSLPSFWNPAKMDRYFAGSLPPLAEEITRPTDYLRLKTEPHAVVAGDPGFARWVSALGARRVLLSKTLHRPKDADERQRIQDILLRETDTGTVREAAARYGIRYVVVTPALLEAYPGVGLDDLRRRRHFREVHVSSGPTHGFVAILSLEPDPR